VDLSIPKLMALKFTSELTWSPCSPMSRSALCGRTLVQYKGLEYSVVQLVDGSGWRWEVIFADGKHRYGVTPVSRPVAIKQAKHEIERALKDRK
jgi:hypothetical protein